MGWIPDKEDQFQLLQRLFEEEDFAISKIRGSDSLKLTGLAAFLSTTTADAIVSKDDSVVEASERTRRRAFRGRRSVPGKPCSGDGQSSGALES